MSIQSTVSVDILGKEYIVVCTEEEQADLITSAKQLDIKMRKMRHTGKVSSGERVAVLAALNLTHELLQAKGDDTSLGSNLKTRLNKMNIKIETALKSV